MHIVSATEEGKEAVKALIEGKEISSKVSETMNQISKEKRKYGICDGEIFRGIH